MSNTNKGTRLSKAAREFNVGTATIVDFLSKKGYEVENKPNTKLSAEIYDILLAEFQSEKQVKEESKKIGLDLRSHKTISIDDTKVKKVEEEEEEEEGEEFIIKNAGTYKVVTSKKEDADKKSREEKKEPEKKAEDKIKEPQAEAAGEKPVTEKPEVDKTTGAEEKTERKIAAQEAPATEKPEEKLAETEKVQQAEEQEKKVEKKVEEEEVKEKAAEKAEEKAEEKAAEKQEAVKAEEKKQEAISLEKEEDKDIKILGKIDLQSINMKTRPDKKTRAEKKKEEEEKKAAEKRLKEQKEQEKKARQEEEKRKQKEAEEKRKAEEEQKAKAAEEEKKRKEEEERKAKAAEKAREDQENFLPTHVERLTGPKILDKIELPDKKKPEKKQPVASSKDEKVKPKKKKRKRIQQSDKPEKAQVEKSKFQDRKHKKKKHHREQKPEVSVEEIQKQIKETLSKLSPTGKSKAAKYRRQKRADISQKHQQELQKQEDEKKTLKVTEFVSVNELATMMSVSPTQVISTCMSLGLFVSINQRLDAETLSIVAEEFGYDVEFVSVEVQEAIEEQQETTAENPEDLVERPPIVTVMGHVDHGKTKLLDFVRHANVVAGEAGGITQHIGAYEVVMDNGKRIVFLDTPGHEAFTAMRARGAKVTDVAVIVIAADDNVMPQTKEAINHAQAAGVPIIFAINKVDKPNANPEKIKQELSEMNILVEDWGGKYQSQEISAKTGLGIDDLMEKILLESELLELKGNPRKLARGTIIESSLDKGRGYIAKILVQNGSLKLGDMVLAGSNYGKVKAMYNERNQEVKNAGPSTPVLLLGLNGAPQAGDMFNVMRDEREAKEIANKRQQLQREQGLRTQKHITLDEIGRRIAIGDFKQLNVIVKGDVDGSVEALSDSLLKLSNEEVQVEVIHKSVGAITESDVLLASASDAIIIGFQVRPSPNARKLAENEQIDIRLYSIIYQAIEELKAAIEGMLSPDIEEKITCNVEVRETFKITKVGTVAGCMVLDGKITRNTKVRIIRDGIVVYTGNLGSLKRYKDDVKEVNAGYECGLNIENFNDIKVGDIIEGYEEIEVKRKL